jgi:Ca2+-binding RTX toxin-like protein
MATPPPSAGDDVIFGTIGDDVIDALAGNDTVRGLTGNDDLDGGEGNDTLEGDEGNDTLRVSSAGTDIANGGVGDDLLILDFGAATSDFITFVFPTQNFVVGGFDGTYRSFGGHRVDYTSIERFQITTGSGNDSIRVAGGRSVVSTGAGDDTVNLGRADAATDQNRADGGIGVDGISAEFFFSAASVNWNLQTSTFNSDASKFVNFEYFELLQLGSGDDVVVTTDVRKNETITLGGGDDRVTILHGFDTVRGDAGFDTLVVDYSGSTHTVENGGGAPFADSSGFSGSFLGRSGGSTNDRTVSFEGFERFEVTTGSGDDDITTAAGNDVISTGAGNDILNGGAGADTMVGGTGDDVYTVDDLADVVTEADGEGTDLVETSVGSRTNFTQLYTLPAFVENLLGTSAVGQGVFGNALDNEITMGSGGDLVVLQDGGNDTVSAGGGNDFLYYGNALTNGDSNDGGDGFDTIGLVGNYTLVLDANDLISFEKLAVYTSGDAARPASYDLTAHDANVAAGQQLFVAGLSLTSAESLTFNGSAELDGGFLIRSGAGADTLTGGAKRDNIDGGAGDDVIRGGGGKDSISGGLGADELWGDAGADRFVYTEAADSNSSGSDWIKDFETGLDKINLRQFDANGNSADGITAFTFIGSSAFTGEAGQLRVVANGSANVIQADINGDGVADFVVRVTTTDVFPLTRNDFEL